MTESTIENDNRLIGRRLYEARRIKKFSQKELAKYLGVTFQQIQKYEKGDCRISVSSLLKASEVLNAPLEFFCQDLYHWTGSLDDRYHPKTLELLECFERLPSEKKPTILKIVRALASDDAI